MTRGTPMDRIRNARAGSAGAETMGGLGRQVGGAYDRAAASAQQAYEEAQHAYHDAMETAEHAYADARAAAEEAYDEAQRQAEALAAQGSHVYDEALKRGRAYGERAVRFTGDNKALALLLAGGVGFVLALAFKRR
jgi:1,6-anhydro-N-acetylmuramate kinase